LQAPLTDRAAGADRALWASTAVFTACFAALTVFSIAGLGLKDELGHSETELGLLVGTPILTGCGALGIPRLLRQLRRADLGCLRQTGRLLFDIERRRAAPSPGAPALEGSR
jgi:hypothetical protein